MLAALEKQDELQPQKEDNSTPSNAEASSQSSAEGTVVSDVSSGSDVKQSEVKAVGQEDTNRTEAESKVGRPEQTAPSSEQETVSAASSEQKLKSVEQQNTPAENAAAEASKVDSQERITPEVSEDAPVTAEPAEEKEPQKEVGAQSDMINCSYACMAWS